MYPVLISACLACAAAPPAGNEDRLEDLFRSWAKARREVRTLVVTFTIEDWNRTFDTVSTSDGTVKVLQTADGKVFASYTRIARKPTWPGDAQEMGLLHSGSVYLMNGAKKAASKFDLAEYGVVRFLAEYLNPSLVLLNRELTVEEWRRGIFKQDRWHTYVDLEKPGISHHCRAIFQNKASRDIPKDMPVVLWHKDPIGNTTSIRIKTWRVNPPDGPKFADFKRPEDRPGWQVYPWLWWTVKKAK